MILTMMIEMLKCWYLGRVLFIGFSLATGQAMTWVWLCWWPNPRSRWLGQCCWPIWNQPMQCWPTKYQISKYTPTNTKYTPPNTKSDWDYLTRPILSTDQSGINQCVRRRQSFQRQTQAWLKRILRSSLQRYLTIWNVFTCGDEKCFITSHR